MRVARGQPAAVGTEAIAIVKKGFARAIDVHDGAAAIDQKHAGTGAVENVSERRRLGLLELRQPAD